MGAQGSTTKTSQIHRSTLPKTYRSMESTKEVCELHRIHQRERELDGIHQEKGECELPAVVDTHRRRCFLWFSRSPPLLAPRAAHLVHAGSAVASPACRRRQPRAPPAQGHPARGVPLAPPPATLPTLGRCPLLKCLAGERTCIFTSSLSSKAKCLLLMPSLLEVILWCTVWIEEAYLVCLSWCPCYWGQS